MFSPQKEMAIMWHDIMEVLANKVVIIILQYISISDQKSVHLKLIKCYRSIMSQWSWGGNELAADLMSKCIPHKHKDILLCNSSTIIIFTKLNIDLIHIQILPIAPIMFLNLEHFIILYVFMTLTCFRNRD